MLGHCRFCQKAIGNVRSLLSTQDLRYHSRVFSAGEKEKKKRKDKKPGGPGRTAGGKRRVVGVGVLTPQRPANRRRHSGRATAAGRQHPVILRGCGGAGVRGEARARTSRGDELIPSHAPRKCRGPPNTRPAGPKSRRFQVPEPRFLTGPRSPKEQCRVRGAGKRAA